MVKKGLIYLLSFFIVQHVSSQMQDDIKNNGWQAIQLGVSLDSLPSFVSFDKSGLADSFRVSPVDAWYVYLNVPSVFSDTEEIIIKQVLVAVSEQRVIKRIKLYVRDPHHKLETILQKKFGEPFTGTASISGLPSNIHRLWNPSEDTFLYFLETGDPLFSVDGSTAELAFSYVKEANEFGKYVVRPKFNRD